MDTVIDKDKLKGMKYADLRKLAKIVGIKANMKADKLMKALYDYADKHQRDMGIVRSTTPKLLKETKKPLSAVQASLGRPRTPLSATRRILTPASATRRILTPASAKQRTSIQRLRTPPSRTASPALRTPIAAGSGKKRGRVDSAEDRPGAKRQRVADNESPAPMKKRSRTNTYELEESNVASPKPRVSSPGTKQLLDCMDDDLSEKELKEKLMAALDRKVADKLRCKDNLVESKPTGGSAIPRFVAFAQMKKQEVADSNVTPGQQRYQKAHDKEFSKMQSIDTYLEKKKQRTEILTGSAQKAKILAEQTSSVLKKLKKMNTPATATKTDSKTCMALFKTPGHEGVPFIPKITSVSKVSFNFSAKTTTPGTRKSPRVQGGETKENTTKLGPKFTTGAIRKSVGATRKSVGVTPKAQRKSMGAATSTKKGVTPFKFNATLNQSSLTHNTSINKSLNAKPKFNLAASLARPVTWKRHPGKLQPFLSDRSSSTSHKRDVKTVKITTKEERREKMKALQSDKRHVAKSINRRGLHA